jgi:hypothetical protein
LAVRSAALPVAALIVVVWFQIAAPAPIVWGGIALTGVAAFAYWYGTQQ